MFEYKVVETRRKDLQVTLDRMASRNWRLVSKEVVGTVGAQRIDGFDLIFERTK
jgi:hypothetical protein